MNEKEKAKFRRRLKACAKEWWLEYNTLNCQRRLTRRADRLIEDIYQYGVKMAPAEWESQTGP